MNDERGAGRVVGWVALALATVPVFAATVATASPSGYWLDSPEFTAAGIGLGIAHPPGQPLTALLVAAVQRIPLGSLSFRAAVASALAAALAAGALFRALEATLRASGGRHGAVAIPAALAGTWVVAGSAGFWMQAIRPEVYAIQAALSLFALERIVCLETRWPAPDLRPLYAAFLAIGLALANHHFLALLLLPAMAPTLARVYQKRGARPLALAFAAVVTGALTYLYLPIRAASGAEPNIGDPSSPARFWWVVSARVFQKSADPEAMLTQQPVFERMLDVLVRLVEDVHPITLGLAALGLYALVRTSETRRLGILWGAVLVVGALARGWLGFVRGNPDAAGYLLVVYAAIAVLAACAIGVVARLTTRAGGFPWVGTPLALAALAGAAIHLERGSRSTALAQFRATTSYEEATRLALPPRSVVVLFDPSTVFLAAATELETRVRPDLAIVPVPFLDYPGGIEPVVRRDPTLRDLVTSYALRGTFTPATLQSLAARRPVYVELDPHLSRDAWHTTVPAGLLAEVLTDPATRDDRRFAARELLTMHGRLRTALGRDHDEPETRRRLLWRHWMDALYFAGHGDRAAAFEALVRARIYAPEAPEIERLDAALRITRTPIDIERFMPD
ncbi:MAG: DUF2723 domain-containing protein [Deltaproteobacteria bacterium]|nr:DUF2723 domain-containing protein [Deltaproteobacteria bacterium]